MKDIINHIKQQRPHLDTEDEFMFFANPKVAQKSITSAFTFDRLLSRKKRSTKEQWVEKMDAYTDEDIMQLYKFSFVRNPWDRVVSAFFYLQQTLHRRSKLKFIQKKQLFSDFVINKLQYNAAILENEHFSHQHPKVYFNDVMFVDFCGRFEILEDDWAHVANFLNIENTMLPHHNKSDHKPYRQHYTPTAARIVAKIYAKDIELFGYDF